MPKGSNGNADDNRKYEIYMLAGFATAPRFMERMGAALRERLERDGARVERTEALFPYGDWSRGKLPQLREIVADMRLGEKAERLTRSVGGRIAADAIRERGAVSDPATTLLLGHSGGGVAAVHAAQLLLDRRERSRCLAVMIGSPKCRIPSALRPYVLSISAAGRSRRPADFVPWFGSHGWRGKHGPASRAEVPIVGGHADYFREAAPYVDAEGASNLERTLGAIQLWLNRRNRTPEY
ncbi:hypothetical protein ACFPPD_24175 [Cohnella suwonensis]|uniref:Thioesterase domain-containing protein n=1 Tax=Cohnella suwonensis TaxID=696072 RepID=A0ABW0M120_9BACL